MGIPSRKWASIPRSEMIVLESQYGVLVVAHGAKRIERLYPYDVLLQRCLPGCKRLLTLPGVHAEGMRELSRSLIQYFGDRVVWPIRGSMPPGATVGALKRGEVVATADSVNALAAAVGLVTKSGRERLRDTRLSGSTYSGYDVFTASYPTFGPTEGP